MSSKSKIEWTDATWTPIRARRKDTGKVGVHCVKVSPECANCYSSTFNKRNLPSHGTGLDFTVLNGEKVDIFCDENILLQPLKWKRPRKIFVCSQTDLFGEFVSDEMIDRVFAVMALCPQHTFQLLTKRAERMHKYVSSATANVWIGVTAGTQRSADERNPWLVETPAAVRFVSAEPLLEAVKLDLTGIDWVIAGGESGYGARPMHPDWVRALRDQCQAAGVAFHFKQWGEYCDWDQLPDETARRIDAAGDGTYEGLRHVGKKAAGRLLDGRAWDEFPAECPNA